MRVEHQKLTDTRWPCVPLTWITVSNTVFFNTCIYNVAFVSVSEIWSMCLIIFLGIVITCNITQYRLQFFNVSTVSWFIGSIIITTLNLYCLCKHFYNCNVYKKFVNYFYIFLTSQGTTSLQIKARPLPAGPFSSNKWNAMLVQLSCRTSVWSQVRTSRIWRRFKFQGWHPSYIYDRP